MTSSSSGEPGVAMTTTTTHYRRNRDVMDRRQTVIGGDNQHQVGCATVGGAASQVTGSNAMHAGRRSHSGDLPFPGCRRHSLDRTVAMAMQQLQASSSGAASAMSAGVMSSSAAAARRSPSSLLVPEVEARSRRRSSLQAERFHRVVRSADETTSMSGKVGGGGFGIDHAGTTSIGASSAAGFGSSGAAVGGGVVSGGTAGSRGSIAVADDSVLFGNRRVSYGFGAYSSNGGRTSMTSSAAATATSSAREPTIFDIGADLIKVSLGFLGLTV